MSIRVQRETAISSTLDLEPEPATADRFMRRLLRVGDRVDRNAVFGARRATTTAIVVSAVRCTITYLLIPILVPFVGFLNTFGAPISLVLSSFAVVMSIRGVRRFWIADHRARWSYTAFIGMMLVLLATTIVLDLVAIISG